MEGDFGNIQGYETKRVMLNFEKLKFVEYEYAKYGSCKGTWLSRVLSV